MVVASVSIVVVVVAAVDFGLVVSAVYAVERWLPPSPFDCWMLLSLWILLPHAVLAAPLKVQWVKEERWQILAFPMVRRVHLQLLLVCSQR